MYGFSYFEPINETSCWLYRLMCTNPHLALLPDSIMTFGAKKSAPMMIKKLRDEKFFESPKVKERLKTLQDSIKYVESQLQGSHE
jgi:hypothetical protein